MKPLINVLFTREDRKPVWIPLPFAIDCDNITMFSKRIEHLKDSVYEERTIAYRSSFGVVPDDDMYWVDVEYTAKCLLKFTQEQLDCLKTICDSFDLNFKDIDGFITFLGNAKNMTKKEISENGISEKNKKELRI